MLACSIIQTVTPYASDDIYWQNKITSKIMAITQRLQFGKPLPIVKLLSVFQRFPVIVNKEENSKKQTCFYNLSEVVLQFKS